jgi:co-chaperonin GroES (HSP10)
MKIRPMRGQVVVREVEMTSPVLWTPSPSQRDVSTHMGEVLALGAPARLTEHPSSPEVPHGFRVGDLVQYHFGAMGTQEARTRTWSDGKPATWMTQAEIDGVWE